MNIQTEIIKYLIKHPPKGEADISRAKRNFCVKFKIANSPTDTELLSAYKKLKKKIPNLEHLLRTRSVRTLSGIAPIAVLTQAYPCPGNCAYCPKENDMPTSYLSNEPAVMRAILCKFDPYEQVQLRLRALENNGHATDKLELIVMGGTWSYHPLEYQYWFILECFRAANDYPRNIRNSVGTQNLAFSKRHSTSNKKRTHNLTFQQKNLHTEQKRNERAKHRIIGLTLETRPDYINTDELDRMRDLGCTRIEIGIQHTDNKILKLNKRGHDVETTVKATELMRSFGFKITYHIMMNLPGSTPTKDLRMMKTIYSDPRFQPDQVKLYPCVVAKGSLLYRWWEQGRWKPYSTKQLTDLLIKIKLITPPWVRIIRVIRDIPEESIEAGNKITNLRQVIKRQMSDNDQHCQCIRCREAEHAARQITNSKSQITNKSQTLNSKLVKRQYRVSNGTEYFLSFESKDKKVLYAFCRLFLPTLTTKQSNNETIQTQNTAIIRELHTYGQLTPINQTGTVQHQGLGKKLMTEAEKLAKTKKYSELKVISGIGVRAYYRKLGYKLKNTYMTKKFKPPSGGHK